MVHLSRVHRTRDGAYTPHKIENRKPSPDDLRLFLIRIEPAAPAMIFLIVCSPPAVCSLPALGTLPAPAIPAETKNGSRRLFRVPIILRLLRLPLQELPPLPQELPLLQQALQALPERKELSLQIRPASP